MNHLNLNLNLDHGGGGIRPSNHHPKHENNLSVHPPLFPSIRDLAQQLSFRNLGRNLASKSNEKYPHL
jgi:hypothetical protein